MPVVNVGKAIIRRKTDGKYLILQSSKWEERPERSQKPDLAGGTVEPGETIREGAIREIREEAGIDVSHAALEPVHTSTFKSSSDGSSINRVIYFVELEDDPEVTLSWEHEAYSWLSKDELLGLEMRSPYPEIFHYLSDVDILR